MCCVVVMLVACAGAIVVDDGFVGVAGVAIVIGVIAGVVVGVVAAAVVVGVAVVVIAVGLLVFALAVAFREILGWS